MNPIVIQIANGNAFFIGIGMTVFAFALRIWLNKRFEVILLTAAWLVGISLVILSSTPISFWLYGFWLGLCFATRIAFNSRLSFKSKLLVTASHTFFVQLDELLGKVKSKNNQIAMFELPLLPFWNFFGSDQRILAKKYNVTLIPKNYLVKVFASKGDTIDGLHLSQKGHNELAKSVYNLLKIEN
jgi:hypothetical protein